MRPERAPERRLRDLASAFGLAAPSRDVTISGVSLSSREVLAGDLFAALHGLKVHGAAHARDAVDAGAVAILTDAAGLSLIHISEPTRLGMISYAVFCLK